MAKEREEAMASWKKETRKQDGVPRTGMWLSQGMRDRAWHWDQRKGMLMVSPWRKRRTKVATAKRMGTMRR
jgi:hypothetical protein